MKHTIKIHEATIEAEHGASSTFVVEDGSNPNLTLADIIKALMEKLWFTPVEDVAGYDDDEYDHFNAASNAAEVIDEHFVLSKTKFDFSSVEVGEAILGSYEGDYAEFYYGGCTEVGITIPDQN